MDGAVNLLEWYLDFALASTATSWSMEQVATPEVVAIVERQRGKCPGRLAYDIFHFEELGVPQTRHRLVAGSPYLISKLQRAREEQPRRGVQHVIAKPRSTHLRGGTTTGRRRQKSRTKEGEAKFVYERVEWHETCFSVRGPAPTVLGRHALVWVNPKTGWHAVLAIDELAALQTFPPTYKWPTKKFQACLQIGNAVPPRVAELLLRPDTGSSVGSSAASVSGRVSPSLELYPE